MGSGLGASGASAVAHVAALRYGGSPIPNDADTRAAIAEAAYACERALTGRLAGRQDHYAAAFGGLRLYRWGLTGGPPAVDPSGWVGSEADVRWLAERLTVLRTGRARDSSRIHADVFRDTGGAARGILRALAAGASDAAAALGRGDEEALGERIDEQRGLIERLSPSATVPELGRLRAIAGTQTVLGCKALGAGGGGCVVVVHRAGRGGSLAAAVRDELGWEAWPFEPTPGGVAPLPE
jgi:D-glycero-alpha-D-manno-heptose-7-phosphate kinase